MSAAQIAKLQQDLAAAKEYLQSVIETQEATNEELQSANEEILSSNEELQSTNEELETAKEELQSANEELTTVNDELRGRNLEITQVNTDLTNLFGSIEIAVVMIGSDMTVRRFTPEAQKFLGLISTDVGRSLLNIHPSVEIPDFEALVKDVLSTMKPINKELTGPRQESLSGADPSLSYAGKQDRWSGDYDYSRCGSKRCGRQLTFMSTRAALLQRQADSRIAQICDRGIAVDGHQQISLGEYGTKHMNDSVHAIER